ncbi:NUDIX hydrolase [Thermoflavimicrobium dichotomicum]|uniref:ADP-ribose pyrophosphatase YjhB, NUDIX family n=1 Tax=Thermoflavimicrobium dichotomicum TaxID=46223 RepID=A0A1I3QDL1_9BACL|nr:NUDIX hydrolase [Thermoflavimicrobium dichotomicum]SFJ32344.1 ADP-ribose pyrophosphatase YjhB, NUDIX family [Thermoflavimicrobium dichotomicum]
MISLKQGPYKFNYRIAGILIHDGKVLLHREKDQEIWALPGGRAEMMEPSAETIVREIKEEIGLDVRVERLIWVAEQFFTYKGVRTHELGFFYLLSCDQDTDLFHTPRFHGVTGDAVDLVFEWFSLDRLPEHLYPSFLPNGLKNLPETLQHEVYIQEESE